MSDDRQPRRRGLRATQLLDTGPEHAFDRLTRLAAQLLAAPVAVLSLVDEHRHVIKAAVGLAEPWASSREVPLSHSIGKMVVRDRAPLIVADARVEPALRDQVAIPDVGVVAYAGVPLFVDDEAVGALCAVDGVPHPWSQRDVGILKDLAAAAESELELRIALRTTREQRALLESLVESMGEGVMAVDRSRTFLLVNPAARRMFADGAEPGRPLPADWSEQHDARLPDGTRLPSPETAVGRALRGQPTSGLVFSLLRPGNAAPIWVDASGQPVRNAAGEVVAGVAVFRDITREKERADQFRALAGNIPRSASLMFDRELRCVAVDGQMIRDAGIDPANLIGRPLREIAGAAAVNDVDALEYLCRRTLAGASLAMDFPLRDRVLDLNTAPVHDERGEVTGGVILVTDRTLERGLETELRRREEIYRAIVQHVPSGAVFMVDRDLRYVAADGPIIDDILRRSAVSDVIGRHVAEIGDEANRSANVELYQRTLGGERLRRDIQRGDRCYELRTVPIHDGARISHAMLFVYDVTERRHEADELRRTRDERDREHALFATTVTSISDGVVLLNADRSVLFANPALIDMFGLPVDRVVGLTRAEFVECVAARGGDAELLRAPLVDPERDPPIEITLVRPLHRVLRRRWTPVRLPGGDGYVVTWHDVTAEKTLLAERERQSLVDALTGIPNRRAAELALATAAEQARAGGDLCVALFDVDHFKRINDELGHAAGDEVLRRIGAALNAEARPGDTVARWGGEEFLALLPVPLLGAIAFCERARLAIESLTGVGLGRVTISIGVAEFTRDEDPAQAIARADQRLYDAKRNGRSGIL